MKIQIINCFVNKLRPTRVWIWIQFWCIYYVSYYGDYTANAKNLTLFKINIIVIWVLSRWLLNSIHVCRCHTRWLGKKDDSFGLICHLVLALLVGTSFESRQLRAKYGQNLLRNLSQVNRFWFGYASQQRPQNKEGYKILFTGRFAKYLWQNFSESKLQMGWEERASCSIASTNGRSFASTDQSGGWGSKLNKLFRKTRLFSNRGRTGSSFRAQTKTFLEILRRLRFMHL